MTAYEPSDITVAIVTQDPFFLFAARGLLGRDRYVRIYDSVASLGELKSLEGLNLNRLHALLIDLDTAASGPEFYIDLRELLDAEPDLKVLCLAEATLTETVPQMAGLPVRALLSKHDLSYCLHLAIRAVVGYPVVLVSERTRALLPEGSFLWRYGRTLGPRRPHPNLTARLAEVVMWRIFVGLDNPDIQDELLLGKGTVREYVSKAYDALGISGELEAFDAMSDWWWVTRFVDLLD